MGALQRPAWFPASPTPQQPEFSREQQDFSPPDLTCLAPTGCDDVSDIQGSFLALTLLKIRKLIHSLDANEINSHFHALSLARFHPPPARIW